MRSWQPLLVPLALTAAGCAWDEPLGVPDLSPVGSGLAVERTAIPVALPVDPQRASNSLFGRRSLDLLTDVRAINVGDTLTVIIQINDRAEFENESERERESDTNFDFSIFAAGRGFQGPESSANADADLGIGSDSSYRGSGTIDRSERLRLLFAVTVTEVLPNGNLIIAGTQEVRVNAEIRVLQLAGVVNPLDISRNNTVTYEKIAEARISYGGRGMTSQVQTPNWGQQIYDRLIPF